MSELTAVVLVTLICVVAALGLWYCGARWDKRGFKQLGIMVGIAPVIVMGLEVLAPWLTQIEYRVDIDGPSVRQSSTATTVQLNVNRPELHHQFELVPRIRGGDPPRQPVHLKFTVQSPKGETVAEGEGDLAPAKPEWTWLGHLLPTRYQPLRWQPLRGQFDPREAGEHALTVEIPQPVRSVDMFVRESHK